MKIYKFHIYAGKPNLRSYYLEGGGKFAMYVPA